MAEVDARRRRRAARSASSSIRPRCRRRASPPARSTSSCARSTSTPPAAAPRSPAPSSRSACSAMRRNAYAARPDPDRARRRPHGQARRHRRGARLSMPSSAAVATMNGRQVLSFGMTSAPRAPPTSPSIDEAMKELARAREGESEGPFPSSCSTASKYTEEQYHSAMEAMIEGAVLAVLVVFLFLRDWRATADLGARHPALGDPDLLVHGPDGLHAEQHHPAGAEPRRGRAGRRRDRRDREYRPAHADGQDRLSGGDRRRRRDRPRRASRRPSRSSRCSCRSA